MADLVQMLWDLGRVAEDAAQRGDDRAAGIIRTAAQHIMDSQTDAASLEKRRERDKSRKRNRRLSAESTESAETADTPGFSPTPPFPTPLTTPSPPPHERAASDAAYQRSCETYTELLRTHATSGDWESIDAFVKRRGYATWKAWLSEMLKLTTGGKATIADLAQVCRDDAALERPIGSPQGLRGFLRSAADERSQAGAPAVRSSGNRKADPGAEAFAKIRALVRTSPDPRQGNTRFIPLEEVRKLGPVALKAYQSIGGASRVIAAIQNPETVGYVLHEYAQAYASAAREVA